MSILDTISYYINAVMLSVVLVTGIMSGLGFYFLKIKKVTARKENIKYLKFDKTNTVDYVAFDNIISESETGGPANAGMIVLRDRIYISGIDVTGYNFGYASAGEKQQTMTKAISLMNLIEEPVQFRQTVEAVNITDNVELMECAKEKLAVSLATLEDEYDEKLKMADYLISEDPEVTGAILESMEEIEQKIQAVRWMIREAEEITGFEKKLMHHSSNTKKVNQIIFSYAYNPDEFTEELSRDEIYLKALEELKMKEDKFSNALESCGCTCKALSAEDITELVYRHNHPRTSEHMNAGEILHYEPLLSTSDSLLELAREHMGELFISGRLEEMEKVLKKKKKDNEEAFISHTDKVEEKTVEEMRQYVEMMMEDGGYR